MKRTTRRTRRGHFADLASYIRKSRDTQTHIAQQVGVSQSLISRIAAGLTVPRADLAERLVEYARIPLDSFTRVYLTRQRRRKVA